MSCSYLPESSWLASKRPSEQVTGGMALATWVAQCIGFFLLGTAVPMYGDLVTAYQYEFHLSGTFGTLIDPAISNLPNSTYPFPQMRGGSFDGTFGYDSMASLDEGRFPYTFASITLRDNSGLALKTITTTPNNFYVTSNRMQFTFGPSAGIPNSVEDLRFALMGTFTQAIPPPPPELEDWGLLNVGIAPPPPSEVLAGSFDFGFLETDGNRSFTYWDLPVTSFEMSLAKSTPYLRQVPDAGTTFAFVGIGLCGLFRIHRRVTTRSVKKFARATASSAP